MKTKDPMIVKIKNDCLVCPFFKLKAVNNAAFGNCHAPDLERAIKNNTKSYECSPLKIIGTYSSDCIIKVPRPDWCPLNIGAAIIALEDSLN